MGQIAQHMVDEYFFPGLGLWILTTHTHFSAPGRDPREVRSTRIRAVANERNDEEAARRHIAPGCGTVTVGSDTGAGQEDS